MRMWNWKKIIKRIIKKSREETCTKIFLNSRIKAVEFYRKCGFRSTGKVFPSKKTGLSHQRMEMQIMNT